MFGFVVLSLLLQVDQIWSQDDSLKGKVIDLKTESLPDPYKIEFSKVNLIDSNPQGKDLKIIGGYEAPDNLFPFKAALYITLSNGAKIFCGGSIISPNYILTAAHCVLNAYSILIIVGTSDLNSNLSQQRIYAQRYIYHHQYNTNTLSNDIALVHLINSINYNDDILPIQLPSIEDAKVSFENYKVTVIGWGKTTDYGSTVTKLRYLNTQILPNSNCKMYFYDVSSSNICTNGLLNVGSCHGDSGSPLIYGNKQIGLVSYGSETCTAGFPSVYTRVSSYLNWIKENSELGH